eukprot:TRINITY_DN4424_c0_g1_i8.p1 TRINITY_DN4424_c0_g1~~TRINITY_DN4424_c0_g1_i8.p1  ORF type:complete len:360 (-),score=67.59 TRINITY_DN4424_c0_g1_i8:746-1825(-)
MDDSSLPSKKGSDCSPTGGNAGLLRSSEDSAFPDELAWIRDVPHDWTTPSHNPPLSIAAHPPAGSVLKLLGFILIITLQSLSFGYSQAIPFQGPANRDYGTGSLIICQLFGSVSASLLAHFPSDRYGRRAVLLANNLVMLMGAVLCCTPYIAATRWNSGKVQYQVGRICIGWALGVAHMTVPVLLAEIAPPRWRGSIIVCHQLAITVGIAAAKVVLYLSGNKDDDIDDCHCVDDVVLQWMHLALAVPALMQLAAYKLLPESPRMLLRIKGATAAAEELARLRPADYNIQDAEDELNAMVEELQAENRQASLCSELLAHKSQMWIAGVLLMLNALTGALLCAAVEVSKGLTLGSIGGTPS